MKIVKRNPFTGLNCTVDIPNLTEEQYSRWKTSGRPIQEVLPHLSADDREFLISGMLPEQFNEMLTEIDTDPYAKVLL